MGGWEGGSGQWSVICLLLKGSLGEVGSDKVRGRSLLCPTCNQGITGSQVFTGGSGGKPDPVMKRIQREVLTL